MHVCTSSLAHLLDKMVNVPRRKNESQTRDQNIGGKKSVLNFKAMGSALRELIIIGVKNRLFGKLLSGFVSRAHNR